MVYLLEVFANIPLIFGLFGGHKKNTGSYKIQIELHAYY